MDAGRLSLVVAFPAARYHLRGVVERRIDFPDFAGSALRGAFGHALRRAVCVTGQEVCKTCPLYRRCAYPAIFETPPPESARRAYANVPQPYVMEPPASGAVSLMPGKDFDFSIVLIGPALAHLALIAGALHSALRDIGRGSVRLVSITNDDGTPVFGPATGSSPQSRDFGLIVPPFPTGLSQVILDFSTPFALARNGKELAPEDMTARDVLMALVRRVAELAELQLHKPLDMDFAKLGRIATAARIQINAERKLFSRHSARQRRDMPMRGLVGSVTLQGELVTFWPFLHLCQWLHAGKKCVFGFGRYSLR